MQMEIGDQTINIMSSADEKLMPFIAVQIQSIVDNLPDHAYVNYFLLYDLKENRKEKTANIKFLQNFSANFKNFGFHIVEIKDTETYDVLARYGGIWSRPAYYSLAAAELLPAYVDRALYLDAGDVLVLGDFRPYYFSNFENNLLIVTPGRYNVVNNTLVAYEGKDLFDLFICDGITRGVFNSGSYVMNLEQIRRIKFEDDEYVLFAESLAEHKKTLLKKEHDYVFWGDQGYLSAFFLGRIKYYGYPEIRNLLYMPFNFCLWYYDNVNIKPSYQPAIIHFAGAPKPWTLRYPCEIKALSKYRPSMEIFNLKIGQAEYYFLWHEYAMKAYGLL